MADQRLVLEAVSALLGCRVEARSSSGSAPYMLTPQDLVNIVSLKEFYKQEGLQELDYPSVGTISLRDQDQDQDLYSSPPALTEGPSKEAEEEKEDTRTLVTIDPEDFFDRSYDYDFTHIKDGGTKFQRGGEAYVRPCGWNRIALRVKGRYEGGDDWLSTGPSAWPVSYSGHKMDGSLGVILIRRAGEDGGEDGGGDEEPQFLEAAANHVLSGDTRGRGVYSTPDVRLAERFCGRFRSRVDGATYEVLLQNRVHPQKRQQCKREAVWLLYIPEESKELQARLAVQAAVRPYGILLKKI
ncbi:uncharacterized protein LOC142900050 [Nelusetta ayraudi]|uniref:uncharacterized protein LOC142900050 n=1 Tax=Nelusetta ayraudi TaxID=303726 RepID=UPI003F72D261